MHTVVLLKMVPDVVEELQVDTSGTALDREMLRMVPNESDDHALEQALIIKERNGGTVTAVAIDAPEADNSLYNALARGADAAIKIEGADESLTTRQAASVFAQVLATAPALNEADLILTGVQAMDDLDGLLGPMIATSRKLPFLGIVMGLTVNLDTRIATAMREYPGGVRGEFEVDLPAVIGIQAAEHPPRYVPVAKLRNVMKTQKIETVAAPAPGSGESALRVLSMRKPQRTTHAEMLEGDPDEVAQKLCAVLAERGLV